LRTERSTDLGGIIEVYHQRTRRDVKAESDESKNTGSSLSNYLGGMEDVVPKQRMGT